jgi:ABC-type glycerol-3-phosphate transport system substrate-binding protein
MPVGDLSGYRMNLGNLIPMRGIRKASWMRSAKAAGMMCTLLFCLVLHGEYPGSKAPVTVTFVDPEWSHDLTEHTVVSDDRLKDFTRETGIDVRHLPTPETALDQLDLVRKLLGQGSSTPDVSGVDVIWPGVLSDELTDLKPSLAPELASMRADVAASYTVKGRLVAVPYHSDIGVLFYRRDLLRRYGYSAPPRTWSELEQMAAKIQNGERARGQKDFWGFLWPGAAGEGLTCNALEWQVSEGGGRILEENGTVSVNNPDAIRSWQRAAHWNGMPRTTFIMWGRRHFTGGGRGLICSACAIFLRFERRSELRASRRERMGKWRLWADLDWGFRVRRSTLPRRCS